MCTVKNLVLNPASNFEYSASKSSSPFWLVGRDYLHILCYPCIRKQVWVKATTTILRTAVSRTLANGSGARYSPYSLPLNRILLSLYRNLFSSTVLSRLFCFCYCPRCLRQYVFCNIVSCFYLSSCVLFLSFVSLTFMFYVFLSFNVALRN